MTDPTDTAATTEPLPCPFCGGVAPINYPVGNYPIVIRCENIKCPVAASASGLTRAEAIARWNTRAPDATLAAVTAERDRYKAALERIAGIPKPPACGWLNATESPDIALAALAPVTGAEEEKS